MSIVHHELAPSSGPLSLTVSSAVGRGAAVVIVPSAFGVAADLEVQMTELARDACMVVAFDPFVRTDRGAAPYGDFPRVKARLGALDRAQTYADLRSTIAWTREQTYDAPVIVLGVCFGGPFALVAAADGAVDGVVTWHGTRMESFVDRVAEMRCPMRFHFGDVDPVVPVEAVERVRRAFAGRNDVSVTVHAGATHGFSHPGSAASYNEVAERAAMQSLAAMAASFAKG
jgi:carboxymethylenebutenolidase